jgi:hypothetical protein
MKREAPIFDKTGAVKLLGQLGFAARRSADPANKADTVGV